MPRSDVVAVIPAYRCAGTLGRVVEGVRRHLERVIVVDDGSDDDTARAAEDSGAAVERFAVNRGKGAALRHGLGRALELGADAVILLDADGQHDPADLPSFLACWDRSRPDLVVGARLANAAAIPRDRYWTNYIGSRILSWMTGLELEDSQSGYRLLSRRLATRLDLASYGYAVESEMLIKASRLGCRLEHVPVRAIYNGAESHFRPVLDTFRISCASIYFKVFDEPAARS